MAKNDSLFGGDETKYDTLITLKRITGSLSIFGCFFMISVIFLFRKYRIQSQRLVLYLSISALFNAIGYIVGDKKPDGSICDFEGWLLTYFDWSTLMWVVCITYNLYMNVIKLCSVAHQEKYFHIAGWLCPPLLFSLLPLIGDNYGPAGAWCWIKHDSKVWRFVMWYIPLFVIIIALFVVYGYITYQMKKRATSWGGNFDADTENNQEALLEDIKVLKVYPFIYLVLSIFPLILRIHNAFTAEGDDVYALWLLTVLTAPLQGAVNAIVFGLDPDTRSKLTWPRIQLALSNKFTTDIHDYPSVVNIPAYQKYQNES